MPLNVRRLVFAGVCAAVLSCGANAQTSNGSDANVRLNRAKALLAARNFSAATAELESLRRSSGDVSAQDIASVMLVSIYLEQAKYNNVKDIVATSFERYKKSRDGAYFGIAGKIIGETKSQVERYRQLGLKVNDEKLPVEVSQDLDIWRGMLELLIQQSEELTMKNQQKTTEPYMLMEEAVAARSLIARDVYDAARWKTAMEDVREMVAESQTKIEEVGDDNTFSSVNTSTNVSTASPNAAVLTKVSAPKPVFSAPSFPVSNANQTINNTTSGARSSISSVSGIQTSAEVKPTQTMTVTESKTPVATFENKAEISNIALNNGGSGLNNTTRAENPNQTDSTPAANENSSATRRERISNPSVEPTSEILPKSADVVVAVGSLADYADRKVQPVYPSVARNARVTGIVRVELKVDENGEVTDVQVTSGPEMLKRAAVDAARRWRFKPVMREGQATRATGFINFNFVL